MRFLLSLLFCLVLAQAATAQNLLLNRVYELEDDVRLESILKDYFLVQGDVSAVSSSFNGGDLTIQIEKGPTFELELEKANVLDKNYRFLTDDGNEVVVRARTEGTIKTFKGYTGNQRTSLTSANEFLQGKLVDELGTLFYIEPARTLLPEAPASSFLVYKVSDVLDDPNAVCGSTAVNNRKKKYADHVKHEASHTAQRAGECLNIKLAIASLNDMYVLRGSSIPATEAFIVAVVNDMDGDYETVFDYDVNFSIVQQIVSTSTASTLDAAIGTSTDNAAVILGSFATWAEGSNGFTTTYDLGNLWTARDIFATIMGVDEYGVVGLAYLPGICNDGGNYSLMESFTTTNWQLRALLSHETGHNFSMVHDQTINPNIMWPSVLNTTTWTSGSIAQLTGRVDGSACLNSTTLPLIGSPYADFNLNDLCKDEARIPIDRTGRNPSSYSWTSAGATIVGGSTASPSISYSTLGTKSLSLVVSNANCGGAASTDVQSIEVIDEVAPTAACVISNTNTTTTGTFFFGLLNTSFGTVNNTTGYPDTDGAYNNFTCQEYATVSSLSIPFSFTVGSNNGAPHRIKVFVDVDNDGIFSGSEELYSNTSIAANSTITPTIVLPGTTLTNTLLRVRVSCAANNRDACTVPTFGEVEDYGLILSVPLPVEMTAISTTVKGSDISVDWSVAQEIDVDFYHVQHSRDNRTWQNVGKVEANNLLLAQAYGFEHGKQPAGTHYYRITSVDLDGSQQTSEIVSARVTEAMNGDIALAPNPTQSGWSTLSINRSFESGSVSIYDGLGRQLSLKPLFASIEKQEVLLDLTRQPKGAYWIVLELDGEQTGMRLFN